MAGSNPIPGGRFYPIRDIHAKDERARTFYRRFGFEPSPVDEFHLMLLLKDLRKAVTG